MLFHRLLSAVVGIPLLIFISYKGGIYFILAVFILMVLGLLEFRNIIKKSQYKPLAFPMWVGALIFPLIYLIKYKYIVPILFFYLLFCYLSYIYYYPKITPADLSYTLLGVMYVSMGFFHLILLRDLQNGFWLVIYAFLIVWSTDTGAYFIGSCLGKHKFAPLISPKKSWEGFVGGIVSSLIIAYIYWLCLPSIGGRTLLYISVLVSVAGQLGDLFESSFKRFAQIKDSGNLIPGHGGILDRFDSILWAAPVTYYLYTLIERMF